MSTKILKVGFDLDGVILYNPIRIFRPIVASIKPWIFGKKKGAFFYFPDTILEQHLWKLIHLTSFTAASGLKEIKHLVTQKKIQAYIITSRYSFLKDEFDMWIKKIRAKKYFAGCFYNKTNMQPNSFKKHMILKLGLDVFVEDNWGVIKKLNGDLTDTKIFWISNIFDKRIEYEYKFRNLKEVALKLKNLTEA